MLYRHILRVEESIQRQSKEQISYPHGMKQTENRPEALRISINEAGKETLPTRARQTKKKWMTKEILTMMDERRKVKQMKRNIEAYARKLKSECNKAKEKC